MPSFVVNSMRVLPGRFYHIYAFTQAPFGTIVGGWAKVADRGPDKLYYYNKNTGATGLLRWLNNPGPFHFNDPTFVKPDGAGRETWTYMYCTALNNKWTKLEDMIANNNLYFAHSTDNGQSWFGHREIVIEAWAPSALNLGADGIKVWQMDRTGKLQVVKLDHNGWTVITPNQYCINTLTGKPFTALNPDVSRMPSPGSGFRLVCNDASLHCVLYFHSQDGLNWTPYDGKDGLLIYGGTHSLLTPALTGQKLTFSYGNTRADTHDFQNGELIMEWDVTVNH